METSQDLYVNLLKQVLSRTIVPEKYHPLNNGQGPTKTVSKLIVSVLGGLLNRYDFEIVRRYTPDPARRLAGLDWPPDAETMIGTKRLNNVHFCVSEVLRQGVPGDLIETGVWRGGCSILMKAILSAHGDTTRTVWLADSFAGLPKPNAEQYPADAGDKHWENSDILAIPLETVQANFERYGLLDDRVKFLKGWFKDTLPTAPISQLAVARLDGDMYESTIQALDALYPKLSSGGFLIVDDYALPGCKAAVDDFRRTHSITEPLEIVDWSGVYWQKK
jgi:O-methyltransferase